MANSIERTIRDAGINYPINWNEMGSSEKDLWEERQLRVIAKREAQKQRLSSV